MSKELEQLSGCADLGELRSALHVLCSSFGSILRLDILLARQCGKHQALCFFRLASGEQEQHLMWALGVGRFGGDLVVIVELHAHEFRSTGLAPPNLRPGLVHGLGHHPFNSPGKRLNA